MEYVDDLVRLYHIFRPAVVAHLNISIVGEIVFWTAFLYPIIGEQGVFQTNPTFGSRVGMSTLIIFGNDGVAYISDDSGSMAVKLRVKFRRINGHTVVSNVCS
ncbi:hypothetical protein DU484_18895 (plasmid) [Haloplanus rubicundus]|uniref:Uncharacterized protein n=1 Tax=Haloplanus rubicundus TaxID=1547898 RepID=A0A345EIF4_9EURY|nr:hypothetical protein DU484_18895 [Haloplanus rubicundus]